MNFGEKLRQARKNCRLTQKELAEAVGAKHNSISNWENGQNQPDAETLRRLCPALKVAPNYFVDAAAEETSALEFALYGEVRQLTEEDKQDVLEFARFKRALREKRRDE